MRTTLDIDEDVLLAVKDVARREHKTAGQVISALARRALTQAPAGPVAREPEAFFGFRPFASRGGVVSNELINRLREDDVY
jgi:hypothetical protein